ncbi:MAG: rRNA (cytosine1962-C5)-methyltransferase [Verrucomicrobiota bacterium]|jgi:23S rRNA (cytosine1962-C5)-methyltransferase
MKPTKPKSSSRLRLRITAAAEGEVRSGHPWVFGDSVRELNRDGQPGELAVIYDRKDEFLAVGFFDPDSPIRVRVLHAGKPQTIDSVWWSARLAQAIERRLGLFDERTNGYRVINGESDGWPGLVLDRYDSTFVLKIYTAAWLPRLEEISKLIQEQLEPDKIILRLSRNVERRAPARPASEKEINQRAGPPVLRSVTAEGGEAGVPGSGKLLFAKQAEPVLGAPVIFSETGLRFEADVWRGQKTGFFLDQRENRRIVESLAGRRNVLNAFSFSGGFSLYAARGGAISVTDLDISAHALESAKRNFALNQSDANVGRCLHETVQADTFEWLEANRRKFELIILDPPSFAKREVERTKAIHAYERLAALGITNLSGDGILVSCSCSAHVTAEEFFGAVRRAAAKSGRRFEELQTTRHAPDHHASFKEAEYLKGIYLRII